MKFKTFFSDHPQGLSTLFFTEMWERFSYYGMRALLILFLTTPAMMGGMGLATDRAASIYGWYTSGVYAACILGGYLADRFFGLKKSVLYGGILITIGHTCLAFSSEMAFFTGLGFIVLGTGLLKPNVSALVGTLYSTNDERRDAGFSIFYMGINLGALIAPFITGYLGQKINWHYGFAAAAVGMLLGLIQYVLGWNKLPDPPSLVSNQQITPLEPLTKNDISKIIAIGVLFIFSALFWGAFEQAGSSLNLFADQLTRNIFFSFSFPSSWYQSINSLFLIFLAPMLATLWIRLGNKNPSSPMKFVFGLVFVGLGFLVMSLAASVSGPERNLVSPFYLILCYFFHTVGELCLSPVGLSTVTKLAPARLVGLMMGVWFLSLSLGNKLGGWVAGYFDSFPLPKLFFAVFATTTLAGLILVLTLKPIKKLMKDVH